MRETKFKFYDTNQKMIVENEYWLLMDANGQVYEYRLWKLLAQEDGNYIPMQYTWLKDKNWKEIYEGDILAIWIKTQEWKVWLYREAVIMWHEYWFCLDYTRSQIENDKYIWICDINETLKEFEIIGNTYENKLQMLS